jgi:hypothetical protein
VFQCQTCVENAPTNRQVLDSRFVAFGDKFKFDFGLWYVVSRNGSPFLSRPRAALLLTSMGPIQNATGRGRKTKRSRSLARSLVTNVCLHVCTSPNVKNVRASPNHQPSQQQQAMHLSRHTAPLTHASATHSLTHFTVHSAQQRSKSSASAAAKTQPCHTYTVI